MTDKKNATIVLFRIERTPYVGLLPGGEETYTLYQDFQLAEPFGTPAVIDTYDRLIASFKADLRFLIELTFALNARCWRLYELGDDELARAYGELYYKAVDYAYGHLSEEDQSTFWRYTD